MKKLMLSTALVMTAATAGHAEMSENTFRTEADPMEVHASEFIGMRVYTSEAEVEADEYAGAQTDWEDIGEINDVILSRSGEVEAVLVDIGGFLGIGERQVAVNMDAIKFVSDSETADDEGDYFLVMNGTRANFEDAPEYAAADMDADMGTDLTAEAQATGQAIENGADEAGDEIAEAGQDLENAADEAGQEMAQAGDAVEGAAAEAVAEGNEAVASAENPFKRDGYSEAAGEDLTAEMLTGAPVYDGNEEWIGEVSEILLTDAGAVDGTVIDVGGFLGIGEKPVELKIGDVNILREDGGDDVRVYTALTKEELEAMPSYND